MLVILSFKQDTLFYKSWILKIEIIRVLYIEKVTMNITPVIYMKTGLMWVRLSPLPWLSCGSAHSTHRPCWVFIWGPLSAWLQAHFSLAHSWVRKGGGRCVCELRLPLAYTSPPELQELSSAILCTVTSSSMLSSTLNPHGLIWAER